MCLAKISFHRFINSPILHFMLKFFLWLGILICLALNTHSSLDAQTTNWRTLTSGTSKWLIGLDFIDGSVGWAVGDSGTILKTTNSGRSWLPQTSGTTNTLESVDFIDGNTGWVVGDGRGGVILKTTNGGTTWGKQDSGRILVSTFFISSTAGWAVGPAGMVLRTTNGGTNWIRQPFPDSTIFLTSVYFVTNLTGWVCGKFPGKVYKTINGGSSWISQSSGISTDEDLNSIFFVNISVGWVAGVDFPDTVGVGKIKKTTDGGTNWINQSTGTIQELFSIAFADMNVGWAVGQSGTILRTSNGGTNWIPEASGVTSELDRIVVRQDSTGWIVGLHGVILTNAELPPIIETSFSVNSSWNIVSVPVTMEDSRREILFPTSSSVAYRYDVAIGYLEDDTLDIGAAYWLKFPSTQVITMVGPAIDSLKISLSAGWNFVGGISFDVPVSSLVQNPPNSIVVIYGYNNEYQIASTIEHGKGYWIKANQNCQITLRSILDSNTPKHLLTDVALFKTDELPPPPPTDALPMKVQQVIPKDYALNQNYPNPFNPSTVIQFALPEASVVILSIYNIVGEQIANLMNGRMDAGIHRTTYSFDSENHRPVSSGIYFYRMSATSIESGKHFLEVKKMLVVK